jgi:ComF family protein
MKIFQPLLNFFLKPPCPLCDRSTTTALCTYCQRQLLAHQRLPTSQAAQPFAWGDYQGVLKRTIAACKYQNHPELAIYLGNLLGAAWLQSYPDPKKLLVIPIPLHRDKQKERGFNQATLIARGFCQQTRLTIDESLHRIKATEAQFQLSPRDRQRNLQDAFQLTPGHKLTGRSILLIDDIYTTGSTITATSQVLQAAGVKVWGVAVVALAGADSA